MDTVYYGRMIHCRSEDGSVEYLETAAVVVDAQGTIIEVAKDKERAWELCDYDPNRSLYRLPENSAIIPGFVDCHVHAPQYANLGLGSDLSLLEWLDKYIFDLEKMFGNPIVAGNVYNAVVDQMVANGTTTACYFGVLYTDSCLQLAKILHNKKQRAFVGKVNMTVNCPRDYCETEEESLAETERFIQEINKAKYPLVQPVITPRFAVSCEMSLLTKLSKIAEKHNLLIQTHISENLNEIEKVKSMNKNCANYTDVYKQSGILTGKTILAHGIYLDDDELDVIQKSGASIIHCPLSNCFLHSGICDAARIDKKHVNIGLGTDMGAGYSPSILKTMRSTVDISSALKSYQNNQAPNFKPNEEPEKPINFEKAFYFATLGGAKALNLENTIGNFEVGKKLDALVIQFSRDKTSLDYYCFGRSFSLKEKFERFFFNGDDRNIVNVFVNGKCIHSVPPKPDSTNYDILDDVPNLFQ